MPYVIAEIGNNHQGDIETALKMIKVAASCGVQAVKFQKRHNRSLYTKAFYNKPYDNENSSFVTKVKKLIRDPELRKYLGQNARKKIEEKYSWQKGLQRYQGIYNAL